jgi:hypothetical protein
MVENQVRNSDYQETGTPRYPPPPALVNGEKGSHEEKGGQEISQKGEKKSIDQERSHDPGASLPPDLPQEGFFLFILPEGDLDQVNQGDNSQEKTGPEGKKPGARFRRGAHLQLDGPCAKGSGHNQPEEAGDLFRSFHFRLSAFSSTLRGKGGGLPPTPVRL